MTPTDPDSLDMPFERQPATTVDLGHAHFASGLVILAASVPIPDKGSMPALVYRFANPDGSGFYPPVVLVVEEDQMVKLAQRVASATAAAIASATEASA